MVNVTNVTHTISANYAYSSPADYLTTETYSNGVKAEYAHDAIGRLTNLTHRNASLILEAYRYAYDSAECGWPL